MLVRAFPWIALLSGLLLAWSLWRSKWPGWLGNPLLVLVALSVLELGISPLITTWLSGRIEPSSFYGGKYSLYEITGLETESLEPYFIILGSYASIAFGLLIASVLSSSSDGDTPAFPPSRKLQFAWASERGWRASFLVGIIGLLAAVYMLSSVLRHMSIRQIASTRAFYSLESVRSLAFGLASMFLSYLQVGSWGMILFGRGISEKRWGVMLGVCYLLFRIISGGRGNTLFGLFSLVLVYHWSVSPLKLKHFVAGGIFLILSQAFIALLRFEGGSGQERLMRGVVSLLTTDGVTGANFVWKVFPSQIPYLKGASVLGGLSHFLPGFSLRGTENLWIVITDFFWGWKRSSGIGGGNFALGAELYANLGFSGVAIFGTLFGLAFGVFFEWQRKHPENPFVLLLYIGVYTAFISGCRAKMPASIGGIMVGYVIPVALIAALTFRDRGDESFILLFTLYWAITSFLAYKSFESLSYSKYLKYTAIGLGALGYLFAYRVLRSSDNLRVSSLRSARGCDPIEVINI